MTRGGDPILIEYRSAATVSTREAEEGSSSYGYLPGPPAERRIFAADYPRFRSREQRWYAALHAFALVSGRNRHYRTRRLLARRHLGGRRSLRHDDARGTRATRACAARGRHRRRRGRRTGCTAGRGCQCGRRRAHRCGFFRRPRPS